jgi:D-glycero-beta-D-manno-heptose 1-phosphate adenylyltransferase
MRFEGSESFLFCYFYKKFSMNYHLKTESKIFRDYSFFEPLLRKWKKMNKTIVFTNGCFDLFHRGHAEYLAKAAEKGDRLIIGLNSDHSVTRLKGAGRPLVDEYSRAYLLASLQSVSAVVLFEENTPRKLIEDITPDFLIKGDDYSSSEIAGNAWVIAHGGKVETIGLVPGFSTTSLIRKIKDQLK